MPISSLKTKLLRNLGANAYGQLITVAIQLVSIPLFLHYWGVNLYGEWLILSAIPAYLSLSDIGFATVAANDMTMRVAKGDKKGALEVYQSTWVLISIVSLVIGSISSYLIFYFPIKEFFSFSHINSVQTAQTLFILMLYVLIGLQGGIFGAGFRAVGRYATGTVLNNSTRLLEWLLSMGVLISGGNIVMVALTLLSIRLLGMILMGIILHTQVAWLKFGFQKASLNMTRFLFKPAIAFMAFPLGLALSLQGMVLIIGALLSPAAVTIFSTYRTLTRVLVQFITMLNRSIWPEISSAYGAKKMDVVTKLHHKGSAVAFWVALISVITLGFGADFIVGVWTHHAFQPNQELLYLLLATVFFNVLWQTSWVTLMATNMHQKISLVFIIAAAGGFTISLVLIKYMGINGAGIALVIAELPMVYFAINASLKLLHDNWSNYIRIIISNPFKSQRMTNVSQTHLWKNRERPFFLSKRWFKVWIKRIWHSSTLLTINMRRLQYKIKGATIGNLVVIEKVILNGQAKRLTIGSESFIGSNVHIALHGAIHIGMRVVINSNVQLLTGSHNTQDTEWTMVEKPIVIKDYAWIAYNSIILPGITIGEGAVVGAGAVVSHNVPDYAIVAGNPAKVVGERTRNLSYNPVRFSAPLEAWLGSSGEENNLYVGK